MSNRKLYHLSTVDRYLGKAFLSTTLFVALIFFAMVLVMQGIGQLQSLDTQAMSVWDCTVTLLVATSSYMYRLSPLICMLGAALALGHLASGNELIVLRSSGMSIKRMMLAMIKLGGAFVLCLTLFAEGVGPQLHYALDKKHAAELTHGQAFNTGTGTWVHNPHGFTHFQQAMNHDLIQGVHHYRIDNTSLLKLVIHADHAQRLGDKWQLIDVDLSQSHLQLNS